MILFKDYSVLMYMKVLPNKRTYNLLFDMTQLIKTIPLTLPEAGSVEIPGAGGLLKKAHILVNTYWRTLISYTKVDIHVVIIIIRQLLSQNYCFLNKRQIIYEQCLFRKHEKIIHVLLFWYCFCFIGPPGTYEFILVRSSVLDM